METKGAIMNFFQMFNLFDVCKPYRVTRLPQHVKQGEMSSCVVMAKNPLEAKKIAALNNQGEGQATWIHDLVKVESISKSNKPVLVLGAK
jgi:hypothetical protein